MSSNNNIWKKLKISECAEIICGGTPSTSKMEYWDGNIPWITPKDLSNYNSMYISKGNRNISELGLKNSSAKLLPKNTILLTTRAPIGYIAIAKNELSTNQGFKSLIMKDGNIPEFFYYLLKYNMDSIKNLGNGTTFMEVNSTSLKKLELNIPPLEEQKKIASILSSLDDKIDLNNRMNKILEEMAQTIFKEWFVNFNFPNEDGKPYKDSGGKMIESELGAIPEGWRVGTINDLILETFTGDWGKDKKDDKYNSEVICIRGADIAEIAKGFNGNPVNRFILSKNLINKKLQIGDIIIECSGGSPTQSTGRCVLITEELLTNFDKPLICTNFCRVIKLNEIYLSYFTYNLLWYLYNTNLFFLFENGTTGIKNLDINSLFSRHFIAIPNGEIIKKFSKIYSNFLTHIYKKKKENQKLDSIRDTLLPKLMSGEIKIK